MEEIINDMLAKASDEQDLDLASIASDLMYELTTTANAPSNWRNLDEKMYDRWQDDEWLVEAVYVFHDFVD